MDIGPHKTEWSMHPNLFLGSLCLFVKVISVDCVEATVLFVH